MEKRVVFRSWWLPYLLVAPQLAITIVFFFLPAGQAVWQSLLAQDPFGINVEFVRAVGPAHIAMRVHERGVGETRSCGTGAAAAALATRFWSGEEDLKPWRVDVPGGTLTVTPLPGNRVELAGPAELVADGDVRL